MQPNPQQMIYFPRFSPNHNERPFVPVELIVLHYTGMQTSDAALEWLCNPASGVSAHYFVEEDGTIFQLVEEDRRAWHAGVAHWRGATNINDISIGIEIANCGHEWGYTPFPAAQITAVKKLCADIMHRHELPAYSVVGHSDVAPTRKQDPGELFPWQELAEYGIGIWHDVAKHNSSTPAKLNASLLQQFGYEVVAGDAVKLKAVVTAFQRHFRPHKLSGEWDIECEQILQSLLQIK
jgi:N-acetylmuramoyl-L-alanine amidase